MNEPYARRPVNGYGRCDVAMCRFAPAGSGTTETLTDQLGIRSITRNGAGDWTVTIENRSQLVGLVAVPGYVDDGALLHEVKVESYSVANGTVTFVHLSATNDAATPFAQSDTVDEVTLIIYLVRQ